MTDSLLSWQGEFREQHQLPHAYLEHAQFWFDPVAGALSVHQNSAQRSVLVAINGCQGSGKTTLCDYLCAVLRASHGLEAVSLSLDDFYLTREQRRQLAADVHPLLATRGVPGTHDLPLLQRTLDALLASGGPVRVPRFDKARDDRRPEADWDVVAGPIDLVLLEGWCMGARPQPVADLDPPRNELERREDADGRWRNYVNEALRQDFLPLYQRVDLWLMLQAPSFDCVYRWRLEQERKLARKAAAGEGGGGAVGVMDEAQLARFIQHYQRLTEHCLAVLPPLVDYLFILDEERRITAGNHPGSVVP